MNDLKDQIAQQDDGGQDVQVLPEGGDDDFEIEVYDDRPEADRREPADLNEVDGSDDPLTDEEIAALGGRAQQRIKKLTWKYHEARRQSEQKDRELQAALQAAQTFKGRSDQQEEALRRFQQALLKERGEATTLSVEGAEKALAEAYGEGDPEAIAKAQSALTDAKLAAAQIIQAQRYFGQPGQQPPQGQPQGQPQQAPLRPPPSQTAQDWVAQNPWFQTDPILRSFAFGIHEKWVQDGKLPDTPEYYAEVDRAVRERFPERFDNDEGSGETPPKQPPRRSPVAPEGRSSSASVVQNGKIRLSQSQVATAKRLGLDLKEYAKQVLLLEERNRG